MARCLSALSQEGHTSPVASVTEKKTTVVMKSSNTTCSVSASTSSSLLLNSWVPDPEIDVKSNLVGHDEINDESEKYPDIGPGDLTDLLSANVSNKNLARVAVRLGLYSFLRRNSPGLDQAVSKFTEDDTGLKVCTVLADMVESIAAAVYRDCDSDLKLVWKIFSKILEPLITLETMEEHPVATLNMLCQKRGKTLEFGSSSCGSTCKVDVIVDGMVMGTGDARQVEIAKLNAAVDVLPKLSGMEAVTFEDDVADDGHNLDKQRLNVYCDKRRWIKPLYKIVKEEGPAHSKKFMCSVTVGSDSEDLKTCYGDLEPKMKHAEKSAARRMLSILPKICRKFRSMSYVIHFAVPR
ncbi:ribonuclease 3-like protein 2 [Curcuma longa]|uniref:ribonuclease 3-like protein 2 n=1 Tax=Curcuma longa TaxID=136217 RepID=UPI003D9F65AF